MNVVNVVAPGALLTLLISVVSTYVGPLLVSSREEDQDAVPARARIQPSHRSDSDESPCAG